MRKHICAVAALITHEHHRLQQTPKPPHLKTTTLAFLGPPCCFCCPPLLADFMPAGRAGASLGCMSASHACAPPPNRSLRRLHGAGVYDHCGILRVRNSVEAGTQHLDGPAQDLRNRYRALSGPSSQPHNLRHGTPHSLRKEAPVNCLPHKTLGTISQAGPATHLSFMSFFAFFMRCFLDSVRASSSVSPRNSGST